MPTYIRPPVVAGQFYPGKRDVLLHDIQNYTQASQTSSQEKRSAIGAVVPHAGYMYSGHVAGAVYARLLLPKRFVILCPNHTGFGEPLAIMADAVWRTPLGDVQVDRELASALMDTCDLLSEDQASQLREHAIEVHLPFLQAEIGSFSFVPITVGTGRLEHLHALGEALGRVLGTQDGGVMMIASSDMNHYESDSVTRVKDHKAIERILALDAQGLYETIRREHITMCGYGPTVAMLTAAKLLGAKSAELIKYATSGDVSGDREQVVGYAGIVVR